jgi:NH3-dependent NAD+ synthetase
VNGDSNSKLEQLKDNLKKMGSVAIGFSGGVDSSFLLKVSTDVLGDRVLAITVNSMFHPKRELKDAVMFAKKLKAHHIVLWFSLKPCYENIGSPERIERHNFDDDMTIDQKITGLIVFYLRFFIRIDLFARYVQNLE